MTSPYSFDQCVCVYPSLSPMHSYTHTHTHTRYGFCFLQTICFFSFVLTTWKRACWWRAGEQIEASGCVVARVCWEEKGNVVEGRGCAYTCALWVMEA